MVLIDTQMFLKIMLLKINLRSSIKIHMKSLKNALIKRYFANLLFCRELNNIGSILWIVTREFFPHFILQK